jgi:pyruvate formate lyase activating enzyme
MEKIIPYLDLIFFDIKHMDKQLHKKYTGLSTILIHRNFIKLNEIFKSLQPRTPLIPGMNDTNENIIAISEFLLNNGHKIIHLLPYHKMGEAKLTRIHSGQRPLGLSPFGKERLELIRRIFEEEGIDAEIYD